MSTKDALPRAAALTAGVMALCLAYSGAALAEGQRGKPDFKKQSMTRSSAAPTGRASKPDIGTASATRAAKGPATKASAASIGKESMARLKAPSAHRASKPAAAGPPATRSANKPAAGGARDVAEKPATRSVETAEARGAQRASADLDMARSAKPSLRAPVPDAEPRQALAMRASPQEPSKRSARTPKEHLPVRMTRGTWLDWLFGR